MLVFLLFSIAWAASYVDLGDRLWCQGEYAQANRTWKQGLGEASSAEKAQIYYRLLLQSSNLAWPLYGVKGDLSLAECSFSDPECALANVDRELFMSLLNLPTDLEYAADLAEELVAHLPEKAMARLVWLGKREVEELEYFSDLDGMGYCLKEQEVWPRGPGGAYYGFGLYGGGQLGVGGSASWTQPNIDRNGGQLQLSVALTNQMAGGLYLNYFSVGEKWLRLRTSVNRMANFLYVDDQPQFHLIETALGEFNLGVEVEQARIWTGIYARVDQFSNSRYALGPVLAAEWRITEELEWQGEFFYTWLVYQHLRLDNRILWIHSSGLAAMLNLYSTPISEAWDQGLWWQVPSIGGGNMLRTAPGQRWRDSFLPSAVFEYRFRPQSTVGIVGFSELAYAENSFHGGGGLGLRIRMPPQPFNTMRFDIGYGDSGWNVLFGAEEFFRFRRF